MDKKDIIILVAVFIFVGFSFYRKYAKKKSALPGSTVNKTEVKNSLSDQPDDYEPYSAKKDHS